MRPLALVCLAALLATAEPIEVDGLWFLDSARGRNLGVKVYHPGEGTGPWPVVLFSHALGGSQWGYGYLGRHLASRGYVSLHCTHPGSDWLVWDGKGFGTAIDDLRRAAADPATWRERPRDLAFLIGELALLEEKVPALRGRLDRGRLAAAGHSLGAYTALAAVGLRPVLADSQEGLDLADARLAAAVALSPLGVGRFQPSGAAAGVVRPVLLITGTEDEQPLDAGDLGLDWRLRTWRDLPAGASFLLVLDGATHMTFAGGGLGERARPEHLAAVCQATAAFLEAAFARPPAVFVPPPLAAGRWEAKPPPAP